VGTAIWGTEVIQGGPEAEPRWRSGGKAPRSQICIICSGQTHFRDVFTEVIYGEPPGSCRVCHLPPLLLQKTLRICANLTTHPGHPGRGRLARAHPRAPPWLRHCSRAGLAGLAGRMRPAGRQLDNADLHYYFTQMTYFSCFAVAVLPFCRSEKIHVSALKNPQKSTKSLNPQNGNSVLLNPVCRR